MQLVSILLFCARPIWRVVWNHFSKHHGQISLLTFKYSDLKQKTHIFVWQWKVVSGKVVTFKSRFNFLWHSYTTGAGWNVKIKYIKNFMVLSSWCLSGTGCVPNLEIKHFAHSSSLHPSLWLKAMQALERDTFKTWSAFLSPFISGFSHGPNDILA